MGQIGFDNDKYGGKLYLEFGGKLFDDYHASRVLPGFQPDSKIRMLQQLRDDVEIVIAVCANDIEKNKLRGDLGISYDDDCLRLMDAFRALGLYVGASWHDAVRRSERRRRLPEAARHAGREALPPLSHCRLSLRRGAHRQRRGASAKTTTSRRRTPLSS